MTTPLVLQQPVQAQQLLLLFHGVGATPHDMAPLGQRLAQAFPSACVVCIAAPQACDLGQGYQWFSVTGVTEDNRPQRVAAAMPGFVATVRHWQQDTGVTEQGTALIGFSQGAIMALESTQYGPVLAGRVIALSGRFAERPRIAPADTTLHLVHGKSDPVIHYGYTVTAAERLVELGADLTADVIPFLGHQINAAVADLVLERLTGYLPQRRWQEALSAAQASMPPSAPDDPAQPT